MTHHQHAFHALPPAPPFSPRPRRRPADLLRVVAMVVGGAVTVYLASVAMVLVAYTALHLSSGGS